MEIFLEKVWKGTQYKSEGQINRNQDRMENTHAQIMLFPANWLHSCSGEERNIADWQQTFDMIVVGNDEKPFLISF